MTEQPVNVRRILRVIRRRWVSVVALVAAGLAVGLLATLLRPPSFLARSGVLLPPSPVDAQGKPLRNIQTEVSIAESAEILGRAGKALNPPRSPAALRDRVDVHPVSIDILEVRAKASTPGEAALLANTVASEYVSYSETVSFEQADTSVALLRAQAKELDERIRELDSEIAATSADVAGQAPGSPEAVRQAALLDALRVSQVNASRQLSTVNSRIADAQLEAELARSGLRVLEPATAPSHAFRPRLVVNTGLGGFIGVVAGVLLALTRAHRDRRLRTRDELANAAAAPVLLSSDVRAPKGLNDYRELLAHWVPTATEQLAMRQAFEQIAVSGEDKLNIALATLPGDRAALGLAVKLASFAASRGTPTALVVPTADSSVRELRSACHALAASAGKVRPGLSVHGVTADVDPDQLEATDLTVTIVVANDGTVAVPTWGRRPRATLAVSSGFATAETVASAALSLLDAGHPLDGVLVVNADPADPTTGQVALAVPAGEPLRLGPSRGPLVRRSPSTIRAPAERLRQIT